MASSAKIRKPRFFRTASSSSPYACRPGGRQVGALGRWPDRSSRQRRHHQHRATWKAPNRDGSAQLHTSSIPRLMAPSASQKLKKSDQYSPFDKLFFIQSRPQALLTCPPPLLNPCVASAITRPLHAFGARQSQRAWAKRLGISLRTLIRLERGGPTVSAGIYATALWLIG